MSITLPLSPFITVLAEQPWLAVVLVFLVGVVLPAVWVPFCRQAGLEVLKLVLDAAVKMTVALRGGSAASGPDRPS